MQYIKPIRRVGGEEESIKFFYENEDIARICNTKPASVFCEIQHLKFVGHIARMDNDAPQKMAIFEHRSRTNRPVVAGPQTLICPDYIGQHILSSTRQHFQKTSKKLSK